jgi:nicotinamidase-related amidase
MGEGNGSFEQRMNDLLEIDPARTVVLTVDLQRDYIDPSVATRPTLESEAERVVAANVRMLERTRALGIPTVHAYVTRRGVELDHGLAFGGLRYIVEGIAAGLSQNAQVGVQRVPDRQEGSVQSDVHPALVAEGDIMVPTKKTLDSYLYSDLDLVLGRMFQPENIIITGVNTDTCVYSTTFSTANRGYRPIVVRDGCGSMRGIDRHEKALELMSRSIAWVVDLDELLEKLPTP